MVLLADNTDLKSLLTNAPGNQLIWNQFLTQLTLQLKCDSSALLVTDLKNHENTHFHSNAYIPKEYQEHYEKKLSIFDSFNHLISKNPQNIFYNQSLKKTPGKTSKSKFKQPNGQNFRFGVSMPCDHNHSFNLLVNRKHKFNDVEQYQVTQDLQSIIPPLKAAMHKEQQLKINSQLFYYTGVHFDGYIIIDRELNILFSNPDYKSFIGQLDCVTTSGSRLAIKNPAIEQQLLSLIEKSEHASSIQNQCTSCQITLIPISSLENLYQWECYKDAFILTFTHENKKNTTIERLEEIYQLSRCEAVCALHFMTTPSIHDIAISTYRSQETIRNHLKHTMQKMDVHNQAELMKKLITLAVI